MERAWIWAVSRPLERIAEEQKPRSAEATEREENRQKKKKNLRRNASKPQACCFIYYIKD